MYIERIKTDYKYAADTSTHARMSILLKRFAVDLCSFKKKRVKLKPES